MKYKYRPMEYCQAGDIVERIQDGPGIPAGSLCIVNYVNKENIELYGNGTHSTEYFKLLATDNPSHGAVGDTIVKISNAGHTRVRVGTVSSIVDVSDGWLTCPESAKEGKEYVEDWVAICNETDPLNTDHWQAKFEAGEDVWVRRENGDIQKCRALGPEEWGSPVKFYDRNPRKADIETTVGTWSSYSEAGLSTNTTQQKENTMNKTTLEQLIELMLAPEPKDATNSKYVGILTKDDSYEGYLYFDKKSEAKEIMARPSNEGKQLHIFEYNKTLAQKPRDVIEVER